MKSKKYLPINQIIRGDAGEKLKKLPDNSIDLVCCDPPYGYSFMNKDWDKSIVSVDTWKECFRVLKDGAFAFVMSAPRQDVLSQAITRLSEAGFNIKFTSIYWAYASGFPKALNISKAVDKSKGAIKGATHRGGGTKGHIFALKKFYEDIEPISDEAKALDGSYGGFQPKPAVEIIIVAIKPLSEKTFADQALKNKKGITWLDDCRIPVEKGDELRHSHDSGRFPANLLVSNEVLNYGKTNKSGDFFSRYFDLDKWAVEKGIKDTFPFLICPKASTNERNEGCGRNFHPTVKPIKLMSYLITLGSRPHDLILDPFAGSGTTCIAAKMLNRNYIGIEKEKEYYEIASKRLKAVPTIKRRENGKTGI